jgi:CRISPR-associated protein Cmr6
MAKKNDDTGYHALPEQIQVHLPNANAAPNLSLKYYKWADIYKDKIDKHDKKKVTPFGDTISDKGIFLRSFVALSKQEVYANAFSVRRKYFEKIEGEKFTMTTACRLVFGMGYDHPTEIGFMFDWTTGLPIIPGSSLKGAARAAALDTGWSEDQITEIFGKEMKPGEKDSQGGRIIFLPAWPIVDKNKAFLDLDVMTPHYAEYYQESKPPADYYSPRPLKFITVPAGIKYQFCLVDNYPLHTAQSRNESEKEINYLQKAAEILKVALTDYGVGAKTNVFYGYFKDPK